MRGSAGAWWRARPGRGLLWVAAVCVGLGAPVALRVFLEGQAALEAAEEARSDPGRQIELLGQAARAYLPWGIGPSGRALERLEALAHGEGARRGGAPAEGGAPGVAPSGSLQAHRQIRRALLGTRTWGVARPALLAHANAAIAEALAESDRHAGAHGVRWHRRRLDAPVGPTPWIANLAGWAWVAWAAATLGFLRRGLDARGHLRPRPALRWGGAWLLALLAWGWATRWAG